MLLDTGDGRIRRVVVGVFSNMNLPHVRRQMYVTYLFGFQVHFWRMGPNFPSVQKGGDISAGHVGPSFSLNIAKSVRPLPLSPFRTKSEQFVTLIHGTICTSTLDGSVRTSSYYVRWQPPRSLGLGLR